MWLCFPGACSLQAIATSQGAQGRHPERVRRTGELKNRLIRCGSVKQKLGVKQPVKYWKAAYMDIGERGKEDLDTNRSNRLKLKKYNAG